MTAIGTAPSALDRPAARVVAIGIAVLCGLTLAFIHRDDLLPTDPAAATDPVALCLAERAAEIDRMVADGVVDADRAVLFKSRAEALCQATVGGGNSPPPPVR